MRFKNFDEVESGAEDIRQVITAWCVWRDSL
jgi:hypothetical protein